ncbi:MAG TPA: alpha/beta hydrolase [Acidimicrobiales bacterium]|nr:alpha/beta hydrolase [Acidimicrobiales bacterium]
MPVDPAAQQILDLTEQMGFKLGGEGIAPQGLRDQMAAMEAMAPEMPAVASSEWMTIEGIRCQIITPLGADDGALPVLIWIHGGGFVIGSAANSEGTARRLANGAGCLVVNVDYPLAPESKFPAQPTACNAVAKWVIEHAEELGGDASRIAVGGDSAGGNLSAIVANNVTGICYQLLVYPLVDITMSFPSVKENAEGYLLTKESMDWFMGHYYDEGTDVTQPLLSPLFAGDAVLAEAPPAHVITAEFDPLRDEGEAYADKLRGLGVATTNTRYDGQIHGFFSMVGLMAAAEAAQAESIDLLRAAFLGGTAA